MYVQDALEWVPDLGQLGQHKIQTMEPISLVLAIVATVSEILPLLGFTQANGVLHGIRHFIVHLHADSDCNVTVEATTQTAQ